MKIRMQIDSLQELCNVYKNDLENTIIQIAEQSLDDNLPMVHKLKQEISQFLQNSDDPKD